MLTPTRPSGRSRRQPHALAAEEVEGDDRRDRGERERGVATLPVAFAKRRAENAEVEGIPGDSAPHPRSLAVLEQDAEPCRDFAHSKGADERHALDAERACEWLRGEQLREPEGETEPAETIGYLARIHLFRSLLL